MDARSELLIRYGGAFAPDVVASASGSFVETVDGRRVLDFTAGQICATIGHNHPRVVAAIERGLPDRPAPERVDAVGAGARARRAADRDAAAAARPRDVPEHRRRGDRGRGADGEVRVRRLRGRLAHPQLARRDRRRVRAHPGGQRAPRLRPGDPRHVRAARRRTPTAARSGTATARAPATARAWRRASTSSTRPSVGAPAAVVAEPVLSAGGVIVPPPGYFLRLAELCAERGMALILDECQTGLGRLGAMYGFERYDVVPDYLVLSKTLGGGVPISAVVTSADDRAGVLRPRLRARHLARLGPDARGGRAGRARRRRAGGPGRGGARPRRAADGAGCASSRPATRRSATCAAWACWSASSWSRTARRKAAGQRARHGADRRVRATRASRSTSSAGAPAARPTASAWRRR